MSQLIKVLCAKFLLHWQCHCSLAFAGSTAERKVLCSAAWRSSSSHLEHRQVPNVRSPEGKRKITDYNNKCTLLPSAGDNTGYAAVHCRWQRLSPQKRLSMPLEKVGLVRACLSHSLRNLQLATQQRFHGTKCSKDMPGAFTILCC